MRRSARQRNAIASRLINIAILSACDYADVMISPHDSNARCRHAYVFSQEAGTYFNDNDHFACVMQRCRLAVIAAGGNNRGNQRAIARACGARARRQASYRHWLLAAYYFDSALVARRLVAAFYWWHRHIADGGFSPSPWHALARPARRGVVHRRRRWRHDISSASAHHSPLGHLNCVRRETSARQRLPSPIFISLHFLHIFLIFSYSWNELRCLCNDEIMKYYA